MTECPFCHGDRGQDQTSVGRILRAAGLKSVHHDPGGIELCMDAGDKVRVSGECNACDERVILRFILNR